MLSGLTLDPSLMLMPAGLQLGMTRSWL